MLPEVERYIATKDEAVVARDAALEEANRKHGNYWTRGTEAHREYAKDEQIAYAACESALLAAKVELENSGDPLVKWMMQHTMREFPMHTMEIMRAMPGSLRELCQVARRGGWCNVFTRFMDQAIADGAVVDDRNARDRLEEYVTDIYGRSANRQLRDLVNMRVAEIQRGES